MSYILANYSSRIPLAGIISESELHSMLADLSRELIAKYRHASDFPDHLEDAFTELNSGDLDEQATIKEISDTLLLYIENIEHGESETNLFVASETESENWCDDIVDELAKYFLQKANGNHLVLDYSSFDGNRNDSCQLICHHRDGEAVIEGSESFLNRVLST
jgi:hypothetical protein